MGLGPYILKMGKSSPTDLEYISPNLPGKFLQVSPHYKFQQGLKVLYQHIKHQCLGTDDPRLVTYDMQVLFIIMCDMNNEFYVQVLFWFVARGSKSVQSEAGRM